VTSQVARLRGDVIIRDDGVGVAEAAADWIVDLSRRRIDETGAFTIALSGGGTPRQLYQALAAAPRRDRVGWDRWAVYFGDERACPPDDPRSNYRMASEAMLNKVPIPVSRIHRMQAEAADLDTAADEYASLMAETLPAGPQGAPRLDCVLLGLGENGHTASLFPGTPAIEVRDRWVCRGRADYEPYDRITLTYPTLNAAAHVAYLVTGSTKAEALRGVINGTVPAAGVRPLEGELHWYLDAAAAASLE
jgi:6-phosphogluconolactonase